MRALLWLVFSTVLLGQSRQVAITFDDLPRGGDTADGRDLQSIRRMTEKLLAALRGVPVTAFVNTGRVPEIGDDGLQTILKLWRAQEASLGNHTFSHADLNTTPLDQYTADILRGEPAITEALGGARPVFFRHPFLHAGKDLPTKRG